MSFNMKNSSNAKLALLMAAALFLVWLVQPTISERLGNVKNTGSVPPTEVKLSPTESQQTQVPTVPAAMPGADPFKAHIEKNGLAPSAGNAASPNAANNNAANNSVTHQAGADPFKAFLEKQKQDSKAAGISPFGK
jgi:hypothetical protein